MRSVSTNCNSAGGGARPRCSLNLLSLFSRLPAGVADVGRHAAAHASTYITRLTSERVIAAKITLYPRPVTAKAARLVADNYAVVGVRNEDLVGGHATAAVLTFTFKPVSTGLTFVFSVRLSTIESPWSPIPSSLYYAI